MTRTKEDFDKMSLTDLLDEVIILEQGDLWDGMSSKSNTAELGIARPMLKEKISTMEDALTDLVALIPKESLDADWWSDELRDAVEKAKKVL